MNGGCIQDSSLSFQKPGQEIMEGKFGFKEKPQFMSARLGTNLTQVFFGFMVINHLGNVHGRRPLFALLTQHFSSSFKLKPAFFPAAGISSPANNLSSY